MSAPDVQQIISLLGLKPYPEEGGFYVETYRSADSVAADLAPSRYHADKAMATAIYYLLTPDTFSAIHRLPTDEIFHFYLGDPVTMLLLDKQHGGRTVTLGGDISSGERPQIVVPRGVWQGSVLQAGGRYALMGTTMAPGFDGTDYETGERKTLLAKYPGWASLIRRLTR